MISEKYLKLHNEILARFKACESEEDFIKEFEALYRRIDCSNRDVYDLHKNMDFSEFMVSVLHEDKYSDKVKAAALNLLSAFHYTESFNAFENLLEKDYLFKLTEQANKDGSILLIPAIRLCRYKSNELRFKNLIIDVLENHSDNREVCKACMGMLVYSNSNYDNESLFDYLQNKYKNKETSPLTVEEIIKIAALNRHREETFAFMAEIFSHESSLEIKKYIIKYIIDYLHTNIKRPSVQRVYREIINKEVYEWADELLTGRWLAYCMIYHADGIFDDDEEILNFAKNADDDVFQNFTESFDNEIYLNEIYNYGGYEKLEKAKKLVEERNHPRKKKLLNIFEKISDEDYY